MLEKNSQDPKFVFLKAIEDLEVFTQTDPSRLSVAENGRICAARESRLERVVGLARCYIGPLFSESMRKEQEKRLLDLKKAILKARDLIQSHSALIERFKEGDESQRNLAESALSAIKRYNAIVGLEPKESIGDIYDYERQLLLKDQEIIGQPIELPHTFSVKYESHPNAQLARNLIKELSRSFLLAPCKKSSASICPTYKKGRQFMVDTFHMKAIRMIETHLQKSVCEIVPLIKQKIPEIDEASNPHYISMKQLIEVDAGSVIIVTGSFKRNPSHPSLMAMPILDSFRLCSQLTHTGFPYSSQHTGWALASSWVEALPLRADQTPLFHQINQRRKNLAHRLLFDHEFNLKVRERFRISRDVFNKNRMIFLPLHRRIQEVMQGSSVPHLDAFYKEAAATPSAFDFLSQAQQEALNLFVNQPIKDLEEEWLGEASSQLRNGRPQEKFQTASSKLGASRALTLDRLDPSNSRHVYILHQGSLLGKAFQPVALQYKSEKMEFPPPLLNDDERRYQACAFRQQIAFLDECDSGLHVTDPDVIHQKLLNAMMLDLKVIDGSGDEGGNLPEVDLSFALADELESYFNSRFYSDRLVNL